MRGGDISNQFAPAIMIDVELLGEWRRKSFFSSFHIYPHVPILLTDYFRGDLGIHIILKGKQAKRHTDITKQFDNLYIPYTSMVIIQTEQELQTMLNLAHIHTYFAYEDQYINERTDKNKIRYVQNIGELHYILGGE